MIKTVKQTMLRFDSLESYYDRIRLCSDIYGKRSHADRVKKRILNHINWDTNLKTLSVY